MKNPQQDPEGYIWEYPDRELASKVTMIINRLVNYMESESVSEENKLEPEKAIANILYICKGRGYAKRDTGEKA